MDFATSEVVERDASLKPPVCTNDAFVDDVP